MQLVTVKHYAEKRGAKGGAKMGFWAKSGILGLLVAGNGVIWANSPKIVGYYTSWAQFRAGEGQFMPENIDGSLLTHAVFAFAKFDKKGHVLPLEHNDLSGPQGPGMYVRFNRLKKKYPHLKTLLSLGGASVKSGDFNQALSNSKSRHNLAKSLVNYAIKHGFDGVDVDWEFNKRTGSHQKCELLVQFLQEIRQIAINIGRSKFLITVVLGMQSIAGVDHYVKKISHLVDWFHVIGYDLHGSWDKYTDANAPLYQDNSNYESVYCIDYLIKKYLKLGVSPKKLVLGMPAYGRSYGNVNLSRFFKNVRNSSKGPGRVGMFTKQPGILAYYEILELLKNQQYHQAWDKVTSTPYLYNFNTKEWISYDNPKSIGLKMDYIKKMGLGGAMLWALPLDDFRNGYPLLKTINDKLKIA